MINVIIAVCTYKRHESLKRCLDSIQKMLVPHNIALEIVVIDNEPSVAVSDICFKQNITYISEPNRGLVFARNAVLKYARSVDTDYLGIIDDDETVSKEWLHDMMFALEKTNADAIAGVIDIKLSDDMPQYLKKAYQFKKVQKYTAVKTLPMGNVMLCKKILNSDIVFNSRFNFTGGEDIDFFNALSQKGFTLFKIHNAQVTEYLMPEKASLRAYFKRQMRVAKIHYTEKYPVITLKYICECTVSVFEITGVFIVSPLFLINDTAKIKLTKTLAKAIGRLLSRQSKTINAYGGC
jgi:glycosyltransferase involved in cell wall biosynthesis